MGVTKFGARKLQIALEEWSKDIEQKISDIVQETGRILEAQAKALAPVDEGSLRASIEYQRISEYMCRVTVGSFYAIYIEYGTGIYAVNGDGRKTPWTYFHEGANHFVTTRGYKAQPFWFPSIDEAKKYYDRELRKIGR